MTRERNKWLRRQYWRSVIGLTGLFILTGNKARPLTCAQVYPPAYKTSIQVAPTGSDSDNCGAGDTSPCKSIQQGIDRCIAAKGSCAVFVRYGSYSPVKPVNLANGVDVWGSCVFDGSDARYRTFVTGSPAFTASGIKANTLFSGFVVVGGDASRPGQGSIAMTVANSSGLAIRHSILSSGRGARGAAAGSVGGAGEGGRGSSPNAKGITGGGGGAACPVNPTSAGTGGEGADYQHVYSHDCVLGCYCENDNYPHSVGKPGAASGRAKGGPGGLPSSKLGCTCSQQDNDPHGNPGDGPPGSPGNPGACAVVGGRANLNTIGVFSATTWTPTQGGTGTLGEVGSGGGGGGSGGMATDHGSPDYPGLPGGGGGCAGQGGEGGGQGGASIALVLSNSTVAGLAYDNALIPGPAGQGGQGGTGGTGGPGGPGAPGSKGHQTLVYKADYCSGNAPGSGGQGGTGGQGGAGSGGAGGNGGPSAGIALVNSHNSYSGVVIYGSVPGPRGAGGTGGNNSASQCTGAPGKGGLAGASDSILIVPLGLRGATP